MAVLGGVRPASPAESNATATLDLAIAQAQASLQKGDIVAAQLHYGHALFEGWLAIATLEGLAGRLPEARAAVENAATSSAGDASATRVLASAWRRVGEPARAVKVLDARPAGMAEDPEAAFLLGTEYLWLKQSASAERSSPRPPPRAPSRNSTCSSAAPIAMRVNTSARAPTSARP